MKPEITKWESIHSHVRYRPADLTPEDGVILHFQVEDEEDRKNKETLLSYQLKFDSENYRIKPQSTWKVESQEEEKGEYEQASKLQQYYHNGDVEEPRLEDLNLGVKDEQQNEGS